MPAEELLELGYRKKLKEQGIIKYFGGKVEFLYRGYLDGVDAAFMVHSAASKQLIGFPLGSNGCLSKNITYHGKSAHAGGSPQKGINALYAANLGLSAINALRETFVDDDHIRVHPIITAGGSAVNAFPKQSPWKATSAEQLWTALSPPTAKSTVRLPLPRWPWEPMWKFPI